MRTRVQRPSLSEYVVIGLLTAGGTCLLAIAGVGVAALIALLGGRVAAPPIGDLALALLFIFVSYFAAGFIGALALWLVFPIKESFLGCVLRGAILAPIIYGVVGFACVLLYVHADVNIMDYESAEDAWAFLRWSFPAFSVLGAVIWGPMIYFDLHRRA